MWKQWNPNPTGRAVGDCAIRAIARAFDIDWETAFLMIVKNAYEMGDMPSADSVWGSLLRQNNFYRMSIPNICPDCYTVAEFAAEHPKGVFVLGLGGHVVTVVDGDWYDTWDSGNEIPQFYWYRKGQK